MSDPDERIIIHFEDWPESGSERIVIGETDLAAPAGPFLPPMFEDTEPVGQAREGPSTLGWVWAARPRCLCWRWD